MKVADGGVRLLCAPAALRERLDLLCWCNAPWTMHLIWFHRVLIGAAVIFFLAFSAWEFSSFLKGGGGLALALAGGSLMVGAGLTVYLVRLRQILKL